MELKLPYTLLDVYADLFDSPLEWTKRSSNYDEDDKAHERLEFYCNDGYIIVNSIRYIDCVDTIAIEIKDKKRKYHSAFQWLSSKDSSIEMVELIAKSIKDKTIYNFKECETL